MKNHAYCSLILLGAMLSWAQDPVLETQALIRDPAARANAIQASPAAGDADAQAKGLGGDPQTTQEIYNLAGDIFGTLAKQSDGSPEKMEETLKKARENPEAFANSLTPEQKQKLHDLGKKIESRKP